jgi:hypothetical protein
MWIRNGGGGGGCAQVSQGFVRRANISGNTFRAATGIIDSLAKGIAPQFSPSASPSGAPPSPTSRSQARNAPPRDHGPTIHIWGGVGFRPIELSIPGCSL